LDFRSPQLIFVGYKLWYNLTNRRALSRDIAQSLYYIPRVGTSTPELQATRHVHHHAHLHVHDASPVQAQLPSYAQATRYPAPLELEVISLETPPPQYEDLDRNPQMFPNYI